MNSALIRTLLVYAIVLPLAVVVGWMLSDPFNVESVAVVGAVLFILLLPLIFANHYGMLVFTWNASLLAVFLPGSPPMWVVMVAVNVGLAVMHRVLQRRQMFIRVPSLTFAMLGMLAVVLLTAKLRGGFGFRALGGESYGSKGYFYMIMALLGYFAFASQPLPLDRVRRYTKMFYLSGLTGLIPNLIYYVKPLYFLYAIFPAGIALTAAQADYYNLQISRWGGLSLAGTAGFQYVLARYGLVGTFSAKHPSRLLLFFALFTMSAASGYRTSFVYAIALLVVLFVAEGLWRTRWVFILGACGLLVFVALIPIAKKLPLSIQRTLSVLPIEVDPVAATDAKTTVEWRLLMWQAVAPDLPKYFWLGKGYNLNPTELFLTKEAQRRGLVPDYSESLAVGDYHNGPLSIYIPFGMPGVVAFLILIGTGILALWRNMKYGGDEVGTWNRFLFSVFVAKFGFFVVFFGAISSDLATFTGVLGLSVALNRGVARKPAAASRTLKESDSPYGLAPASA